MPIRLGLVGKTNTVKITFFNAATLSSGIILAVSIHQKKIYLGDSTHRYLLFILNSTYQTIQTILVVWVETHACRDV